MDAIKHVLVPEHTKISEDEKNELYEKHKITFLHLPKIRLKDQAIAHLKVKEGDVIKITRKSDTSGDSVFYRGVVNE